MIVGKRVPPVTLAALDDDGTVTQVGSETLLAGVKAIVIGVPGAFTLVCTHQHLPEFVENAAQFRRAGFSRLLCIVTSDPYALAAWSRTVDPGGRLRFLSDGNLAFARALGLVAREEGLFLGERSCRYLMTTENAVVTRLRVESSILSVTCTRASDVVELD